MLFRVIADKSKSNIGKLFRYGRVKQNKDGSIYVVGYMSGREHSMSLNWPINLKAEDKEAEEALAALDINRAVEAAKKLEDERRASDVYWAKRNALRAASDAAEKAESLHASNALNAIKAFLDNELARVGLVDFYEEYERLKAAVEKANSDYAEHLQKGVK
jgi:hypothetical protein